MSNQRARQIRRSTSHATAEARRSQSRDDVTSDPITIASDSDEEPTPARAAIPLSQKRKFSQMESAAASAQAPKRGGRPIMMPETPDVPTTPASASLAKNPQDPEHKVAILERENAALKPSPDAALREKAHEISALKAKVQAMEEQQSTTAAAHKKKLVVASVEAECLENTNRQLEEQLNDLNLKLANSLSSQKYEALATRNEELRLETAELKARLKVADKLRDKNVESYKKNLWDKAVDKQILTTEVEDLKSKISALKKSNHDAIFLGRELTKAVDATTTAQRELSVATQKEKKLLNELAKVKAENTYLTTKIQDLDTHEDKKSLSDLKKVKAENTDLKAKIQDLNTQIVVLNKLSAAKEVREKEQKADISLLRKQNEQKAGELTSLDQQIKSLQQQIATLQVQVQDVLEAPALREQNHRLLDQKDVIAKEVKTLKEQNKLLLDEKLSAAMELEIVRDSKKQPADEMHKLQTRSEEDKKMVAQLPSDLKREALKVADLDRKLKISWECNKKQLAELKKTASEKEALQKALQQTKDDLAASQRKAERTSSLADANAQNKLSQEHISMTKNKDFLREELDNMEAENKKLAKTAEEAILATKAQQAKSAELQNHVDSLGLQVADLSRLKVDQTEMVTKLESETKSLTERIEILKSDKADLKRDVVELSKDCRKAEEKLAKLQELLDQRDETITAKNAAIKNMEADNKKLVTQKDTTIAAQAQRIDALNYEVIEVKGLNKEKSDKADALQKTVVDQKREMDALRTENDRLRDAKDGLEKRLDAATKGLEEIQRELREHPLEARPRSSNDGRRNRDADAAESSSILGGAKAKELQAERQRLADEVMQLTTNVRALVEEIDGLKYAVSVKDETIKGLEEEIGKLREYEADQVMQLPTKARALGEEIDRLKEAMKGKDEKIKGLEEEVEELREDKTELAWEFHVGSGRGGDEGGNACAVA
ncbi:hypothetical protein B0T17DRAFT_621091 [Bombardia bombarda]|uniref:Uncharacterized protein n=1 Tax=Bombardia bombarda TaxID=252184 RepID=A0AA39TKJ1_9PEZI|nr:hypothetical protein B0T17DRAFT_621091 [Bombardia bombarda]